MNHLKTRLALIALFILVFASTAAYGKDQGYDQVEIQTIHVADGIYMLMGKGGNLGVSVGDESLYGDH